MSRSTKGYVTLNKRICHAQQKDMSRSTKGCVTLNKRMCHAQQKDVSRSTKGYVTLNKRICHAQQKDMSRSTKLRRLYGLKSIFDTMKRATSRRIKSEQSSWQEFCSAV